MAPTQREKLCSLVSHVPINEAGDMVVAVLFLALYSFGFKSLDNADSPQLYSLSTEQLFKSSESSYYPIIKLFHSSMNVNLTIRVIAIFDELHIHAHSCSTADEVGLPRTATLKLDPSDYVYPSTLLSLDAFTCKQFTVRLHPLMTCITSLLLYPICFGDRAVETPSLQGASDALINNILELLTAKELLAVDATCKRFHSLAKQDYLWTILGGRDFSVGVRKFLLYHNLPVDIVSKCHYLKATALLFQRKKILATRAHRLGDRERDEEYWSPRAVGLPRLLSVPPFPPLQPDHISGFW